MSFKAEKEDAAERGRLKAGEHGAKKNQRRPTIDAESLPRDRQTARLKYFGSEYLI